MNPSGATATALMVALVLAACGEGRPRRAGPSTDATTQLPGADLHDSRTPDSRAAVDAAPSASPSDAGAAARDTGGTDASASPDGAAAADAASEASATDAGAPTKLRYYPGFWLKAHGPIEINAKLEDRQLDRMYGWIKGDAQLQQAVRGMVGTEYWRTYERDPPDGWSSGQPVPADLDKHHFDWTQMDRILAWHKKRGLRYWATLSRKMCNKDTDHVAPDWAQGDFEYNRPADSGGKCPKRGNIVPLWEADARDAFAVFVRAFVTRYGHDDRLGMISFAESDPFCSKLPNYTKEGDSKGQMHLMTVARQAGPTLNVVKMVTHNLWEMIADHGRALSAPVGLSGPDVRPFRGYPDGALYATTHAYARKHADQMPVFWQVQAPDLLNVGCVKAEAWGAMLPQCKTQGDTPCKVTDLACYLIEHMRVDGIAFTTYEDKRTEILAAIRAYKDALPASSFRP